MRQDGLILRQGDIQDDSGQECPGAEAVDQEVGVLAHPAKAGPLGDGPLR